MATKEEEAGDTMPSFSVKAARKPAKLSKSIFFQKSGIYLTIEDHCSKLLRKQGVIKYSESWDT